MNDDILLVRSFVSNHTNGIEIADDEDMFSSGYLNSLFAVQLVMWVERTFDISLTGTELALDNFRTIARVTDLIRTRRAEPLARSEPNRAAP